MVSDTFTSSVDEPFLLASLLFRRASGRSHGPKEYTSRHGPELFRRRARVPRRGARLAAREPARRPARQGRRATRTSRRTTCCAGTASSPSRAGSRPRGREEWGGTGWNVVQRYIFEEECGYAGAPPLIPFGLTMCGPVLLRVRHATRRSSASCRASTTATTSGARAIRSRARASDLASLQDARRARRRPLRRQRPEDLDHARALRRLDLLPGAHRLRRRRSRRASRSC